MLNPKDPGFDKKLFNVYWMERIWAFSPDGLERHILAASSNSQAPGLEPGDSRYLVYLPPDDRRMLRPNDAPIAHSKAEYRTSELEYQFGEHYHLDAAYLPAPQAGFGRLSPRYAYIACDHKSGHGLFHPSLTL